MDLQGVPMVDEHTVRRIWNQHRMEQAPCAEAETGDSQIMPRHLLLIIRKDGSWNVMEDTPRELDKYRPKRDEQIKRFRKWS